MPYEEQHLLVLGLPDTGKSSFIQALDEVLKHPAAPDDLRAYDLADDRSYLQSGKEQFLAGEKLTRTDRQVFDTAVELWFERPKTGIRARLQLPDKKGEVFRDQWVNRNWSPQYRESLRTIDGILLFIRADTKARNDERLGYLAKEKLLPEGQKRPWDMKDASAQVQVVEILQFIVENGAPDLPLKVAVMISAWDTVGKIGDLRPKQPMKFLEKEWPLLPQYLRSNPKYFSFDSFGVSAYGGIPGELGALSDTPPHKRATLVDWEGHQCSFTRPLEWILDLT